MTMKYYIIFPGGRRNEIDVAHAHEYEKDDYSLASRNNFEDEVGASEYAMKLAHEHKRIYMGKNFDKNGEETLHNYLD